MSPEETLRRGQGYYQYSMLAIERISHAPTRVNLISYLAQIQFHRRHKHIFRVDQYLPDMSKTPLLLAPAHADLDSTLLRKYGKEVANYFSGVCVVCVAEYSASQLSNAPSSL